MCGWVQQIQVRRARNSLSTLCLGTYRPVFSPMVWVCHTILYHTMSYHVMPYHTLPYHTSLSCALGMPYTIPCHTMPYQTIPYEVYDRPLFSPPILWPVQCPVLSSMVWVCHTIPYKTVPCCTYEYAIPYPTIVNVTIPYGLN